MRVQTQRAVDGQSERSHAPPVSSSAQYSEPTSPSRPPQSRGAPSALLAAFGVAGGSPVQAVDRQPGSTNAAFFCDQMNRPDLVRFEVLLARIGVEQFAYAGSLALQIHGHFLDCTNAKERQPQDIDIVVDEAGVNMLKERWRAGDPDVSPTTLGDVTTLGDFKNFMFEKTKVDVINSNFRRAHHRKDVLIIDGVRVLSIEALKRTKWAASGMPPLSDLENQDTTQQHLPENESSAKDKASRDIQLLNELKNMAVPAALADAYANNVKENTFGGIG